MAQSVYLAGEGLSPVADAARGSDWDWKGCFVLTACFNGYGGEHVDNECGINTEISLFLFPPVACAAIATFIHRVNVNILPAAPV